MKVTDESTLVFNENNGMNGSISPKQPIEKDNRLWQSVLIGGIPGILLGSAGTVFATAPTHEQKIQQEGTEDEITAESQERQDEIAELKDEIANLKNSLEELQEKVNSQEVPVETVPVAHNIDETMSFSEAFAAARAEVGAGGVFTWHGNVYSTYYENEWNNMSATERNEFASAVRHTDYQTEHLHESSNDLHYQEVVHEEGEVHVLGQETIETEDGQLINVARVEVDGHYGEIYDFDNDGQPDAALIDLNDDGKADIAMVDNNGNGVIEQDEVYQITPNGMIAMNDPSPEDVLYDGLPDYTNDADVSGLV